MGEACRVLTQMAQRRLSSGGDVTSACGEPETAATLLRSGRSITELQKATGGDLARDPDGKHLYCKVCAPDPKDTKKRGMVCSCMMSHSAHLLSRERK